MMHFHGLGATAVISTLCAFAVVVGLLHLLRLRKRKVVVPYAALWLQALGEKRRSAFFSRTNVLLSLLLSLLVVAALVTSLGDPRPEAPRNPRTVVFLIDTSASMGARTPRGTRLDEAKALVLERIDALSSTDRALIARVEHDTTPMSPITSDKAVLRTAVRALDVADVAANARRAYELAVDVLADSQAGRLVFVSDGRLAEVDAVRTMAARSGRLTIEHLLVGKPAPNVGITAFAVRRYTSDPTRSEALLRLRNYHTRPTQGVLSLLAGERLVHEERFELGAKQELSRVVPDLTGADRTLMARIDVDRSIGDALAADDRAYARLPERKRLRVLLVTTGNRYLEAALLLDEYLMVDQVVPAAYRGARGYDAVMFDAVVPKVSPATAALYVAPRPEADASVPFTFGQGELTRPYFDKLEREHPLLRHVALSDVNIARAARILARPQDTVVAATKTGEPLIVAGRDDTHPFVVMTFDLRDSDLSLRIAWPLFVLNALAYVSSAASDDASSQAAGTTFRVQVPEGASRASFIDPDGHAVDANVRDGLAMLSSRKAGFHTLRTDRGDRVVALSAASDLEGELEPVRIVESKPASDEARSVLEASSTRPWAFLAALALALLTLEWVTYHRRWTS